MSRFVCDFNRTFSKAIYANNSEKWLNILWKKPLTKRESEEIQKSYREFYFMLTRLLETYSFNIIFDGHSMKDLPGRPNISFGTKYIPKFYFPIVKSMQRKMRKMGYSPVMLNTPYKGGNILNWLSVVYPNVFICSMEINKKLYMTQSRLTSIDRKVNKINKDLSLIFDIDIDDECE